MGININHIAMQLWLDIAWLKKLDLSWCQNEHIEDVCPVFVSACDLFKYLLLSFG